MNIHEKIDYLAEAVLLERGAGNVKSAAERAMREAIRAFAEEEPTDGVIDALVAMPELHDVLRNFCLHSPGGVQWAGTANGDSVEAYARRRAAHLLRAMITEKLKSLEKPHEG